MTAFPSERRPYPPYAAGDDWRGRRNLADRGFGGGSGLMLAGLAVLTLGALGWYYLGPDLRRYLKIKSM